MLRLITEGKVTPEEAVRAYHWGLQAKNIKPRLPIEKDLELTDQAMSYDATSRSGSSVAIRNNPLAGAPKATSETVAASKESSQWPLTANGSPDFEKMNSMQRRAYDQHRLTHRFG